ncbi:hypothetical protein PTSG_01771 [Salpingoeca rosetta]|uniref:Dynamin-type G domain-containing protein n=1 Tax=Salpingoeca rosetta (strain ATCC 50818 / BSB-021) TaxID=946362 RepID=F2TYX1_SALR5|nr:uncharacterized protein PTSG_01771 [Salpingoeca rosetta]EGD78795.1 hypothetical protein PTSG_01771 [Salpingoeca rosetta]|eukprot:XP_004997751.1 hypothetical protein PTSG_01771 [Salpingoeca rosetta]
MMQRGVGRASAALRQAIQQPLRQHHNKPHSCRAPRQQQPASQQPQPRQQCRHYHQQPQQAPAAQAQPVRRQARWFGVLSSQATGTTRATAAARSGLTAQRRHASAGVLASLFVLSRRAVLYPAIVIGGIGAAAGEIKKHIPDMELPPGISDLSEGVDGILGYLRTEMGHVRARMTPGIADEHGNIKPHVGLVPTAHCTAASEDDGTTGGDGDPSTPPAGAGDGDDDDNSATGRNSVREEEHRQLVEELRAQVQQGQEAIDALQQAMRKLREEKETEIALLHEQLADLQEQLNNSNDAAQQELQAERARLHKVIDQLKAENEELHRLQIIRQQKGAHTRQKRAIDLFAEILDLRSQVDSSFDAQERLPRVVVVGDQSAGKTSVLEVLVRARIFPRGAGEMMTRAPIQVTMSEGAHHVARIRDEDVVYNLRSDADLRKLRDRIEDRMLKSLDAENVVSSRTLALELEGPGLQPMVLVDLPGIIQHHTRGMPTTTKNSILGMCKAHIANPNAIILCIQDASRDAESSSVADLVREADPEGDRTVFVLTKVDLAEKLSISKQKLRATLNGERFNMHARAYFAVVTGTANPNDSIDTIRRTERQYFASSPFFKSSQVGTDKLGTDNLSRMVSDIFWERVRETETEEKKNYNKRGA